MRMKIVFLILFYIFSSLNDPYQGQIYEHITKNSTCVVDHLLCTVLCLIMIKNVSSSLLCEHLTLSIQAGKSSTKPSNPLHHPALFDRFWQISDCFLRSTNITVNH